MSVARLVTDQKAPNFDKVSILVLLDVGREVFSVFTEGLFSLVSILVLLDVGREDQL